MNSTQETITKLAHMKLFGMAKAYQALLEAGKRMDLTIDEAISHLVDNEWDDKHNRRLERLIKAAKFRYQASMEELNYTQARNLDKNQVVRLADCTWIERSEDILLTGPTGIGKSFIGTALGFQACQYGHTVGYHSATRIFKEIDMAKKEGNYLKYLNKIMKNSVLILDDFGLESLNLTARMALLEILEDRHNRKSTIIVSQIPVELWHETIGDPTIADAIMDRIAFKSHRIDLDGGSMRKIMYSID
jgi:DNA replication protein DnaC